LHVFIQDILKRNNLKTTDLDAVAVSAGPGSYTGLRIGIASAKGLCYALDIPLIALSTLEGIQKLDITKSQVTIPMLDARRMEVYAAVYENNVLLEAAKPVVLDEKSFAAYITSSMTTFIGTGTGKFNQLLGVAADTHFVEIQPTALTLCDLAISAYGKSDTVDVAYFEPLYLKEFVGG
jgi:tRNA threonylcarbamoyladenosine biosynthesis protein TsaB